ncbi:hypothetical protein CLF_101624 [Clonorchis sinensis]|uniref:G-protein coupled receptors family 1 profile domain-containing protein n=1 Tax=Clonorchis sinensis TaxID=79923 RepID=H2KPB1_CLOSI|nr:hypothetical protein CLF_101624 [Clonorchis sinensis]
MAPNWNIVGQTPVFMTVVLTSAGSLGFVANIILLFPLFTLRRTPKLLRLLLTSQCLLDMLVCLFALFLTWNENLVDKLPIWMQYSFCYIWQSQLFFWATHISSSNNLLCLSLQILWATAFGTTYKKRQLTYILICYLLIVLMTTILSAPIPLLVEFNDAKCTADPFVGGHKIVVKIHAHLWLLLYFLAPSSIMLSIYAYLVRTIRWKPQSRLTWEEDALILFQDVQRSVQQPTATVKIYPVLRAIVIMGVTFVCSSAYGPFAYLLSAYEIYAFAIGSIEQYFEVMLATFSSLLHPLVLFALSRVTPAIGFRISSLHWLGHARRLETNLKQRPTDEH